MKNICMYGSSSNALDKIYYKEAYDLSKCFAEDGYGLVFGGGAVGLMGAAAEGMHDAGASISGVIPEALNLEGIASTICSEMIITKTMRERKAKMEEMSEGFIALPGGYGTLEEILEIITLKQLRYHNKPIVFFNTKGFYDPLFKIFMNIETERFAHPETRELFYISDDKPEVVEYIKTYSPKQAVRKWLAEVEESV